MSTADACGGAASECLGAATCAVCLALPGAHCGWSHSRGCAPIEEGGAAGLVFECPAPCHVLGACHECLRAPQGCVWSQHLKQCMEPALVPLR